MKKLIVYILGLVLFSCNNEKYDLVIPMSDIYLNNPSNGYLLDLNDSKLVNITFNWDKEIPEGAILIFSDRRDLSKSVVIDAGKNNSYDIDPMEMDQIASQLGIQSGKSGILYWTVKSKENQTAAASSVYTIELIRVISNLVSPADQAEIELLVDKPQESITFQWKNLEQVGNSFSLCFSLDVNMKQSVQKISDIIVNDGITTITANQLQEAIELLDISRFSKNSIYWNVLNNETGNFVSRSSNNLLVTDMLRFTDVRGDEKQQYRVAKLTVNGEIQYWMAENLRTSRMYDGTELTKGVDYQTVGSQYLNWCSSDEERENALRIYGLYYTLDAAIKVTPRGWRLPSYSDWRALYDAAGIAGSYSVLKDPVYYVPTDPNAEKSELLGEWGLNLVSSGQWWGGDNSGGDNEHTQHIYLLCTESPGNGANYFVQSGADNQFWPQEGSQRGAAARYYYVGEK